MMAVLLIAEVNDGALAMDATAKAVTAAQSLGEVTVLCAGASAKDAADEAAKIDGVAKVLVAEDALYGHRLAEPVADLIVRSPGDYSHIVAPATTDAKNILPRVAALLDVMILTDVTAVVDADTFERPIYAGNAIQTVKSSDATKVMTIRTSTFDAAGTGRFGPGRGRGDGRGPASPNGSRTRSRRSDRPELTIGRDRRLGRSRRRVRRGLRPDREAGRQAGRRRRRVPRGGRFGLCPERLAGRPDRQGRRAGSLHRRRHLGRDPAPCGDEGLQDHRRDQQGRRGADLPGRRLRPCRATCSPPCRN